MIKQKLYVSFRRPVKQAVRKIIDKITTSFELRSKQNVVAVIDDRKWPESRRAIEEAVVVLIVIDDYWLKADDEYGRRLIDSEGDNVRRELRHALDLEAKTGLPIIIPITVDEASMPPRDVLPADLGPLTEKQSFNVNSGNDADLDRLCSSINEALETRNKSNRVTRPQGYADSPDIQVDWVSIKNFRGFKSIEIDFTPESTLSGNWTCISGINGAGKSTILQTIALLLLGPKKVMELGGRRMSAMRHRGTNDFSEASHLKARVQLFGKSKVLEMVIDESGPRLGVDNFSRSANTEGLLFVAYGASRNLSDSLDRHEDLSEETQGVISLFDPMAQLRSARLLFDGEFGRNKKSDRSLVTSRELFQRLFEQIFDEAVSIGSDGGLKSMEFNSGTSLIQVFDLPDGYRSTAAWLADLCVRWVSLNPNTGTSPSDIEGIVLIDELDLHLHASLQRGIVPRLREALPNVQWIITSHAPLILASFDRNEMVALDQDVDSGYRVPKEQIYGFSADQIFDYILQTSPASELSENLINDRSNTRQTELHQALGTIEDSDVRKERLGRIKRRISNFKK